MSHRLSLEDYEIPTHLDEVGYLNDLSIAIKTLLHDIEPNEYTPQLDFVMLARWQIEHEPNILRCANNSMGSRLFSDKAWDYHAEDAARITEIIQKLMGGLKVDNPIRDITHADIDTIAEVRKHLEGCREKVIWR